MVRRGTAGTTIDGQVVDTPGVSVRSGRRLVATVGGRPDDELRPAGGHGVEPKPTPGHGIEFETDAPGVVRGAAVTQPNRIFLLGRAEPPPSTARARRRPSTAERTARDFQE